VIRARFMAAIAHLNWPQFSLAALALACCAAGATDFAQSRYAGQWLRHPVYGDPSFDAFERLPGNPIHRGAPPFEWPVNGFLFHDPAGGADYVYVGDYGVGYLSQPSRCVLYRSTDGMRSWTNLGVVLHGEQEMFDRGGHTPDVSVLLDAGRYHMLYDWGETNFNAQGGLAYAWADKPEGPWHRAPEPVTRNTSLSKLLGRYQRTYAGTLIRRKHDWLIVAMMDAAPNSWALFGMTAPQPEGPWSERRLLRHVESDGFHPPLMEFFPAFVHGGFVYAPATSVALNRDFNALFRAPLERAAEEGAWELAQYGSFWHSEDTENEAYGLWGQTPSCSVSPQGTLHVMFNSRDTHGMGTVNLAQRQWNQPLRRSGFVLTGHQGPSFTCLRQTFRAFKLEASLRVHGTALLVWDYRGALGPNLPQSDATLHPLARTRFQALELSAAGWKLLRVDEQGHAAVLASGTATNRERWHVSLERRSDGSITLSADGRELWRTGTGPGEPEPDPGALGFWVEPHTHLSVDRFEVRGHPQPARLSYLGMEALLGAGENLNDWTELRATEFQYGLGLVTKRPAARVKWNVTGTRFTLWSPRGPDFGDVEVRADGRRVAVMNLHADRTHPSQPVWHSKPLRGPYHAIVLQARTGTLPVDCLECED
jgi:hypothetical protein